MKNLLLISTLLIIKATAFSQQPFCPPGARWHYNFTSPVTPLYGVMRVTYTGDTLVGGVNCKRLKTETYNFIPPDSLLGISYRPDEYIFQDGDTVFRYQNGQFIVWFNFGASPGDEWVIDNNGAWGNCDTLSTLQLISTGTTTINGELLRTITVDTVGLSPFGYHGTILERVGPTGCNTLFPFDQNCDSLITADYHIFTFSC